MLILIWLIDQLYKITTSLTKNPSIKFNNYQREKVFNVFILFKKLKTFENSNQIKEK